MLFKRRSSVLFTYTVFLLLLMSFAGFYSIYITTLISNDAMIINKLGIIRGSMQRAVKLELNNQESDDVITKVDDIIDEFNSNSVGLFDKKNQIAAAIKDVEVSWNKVKLAINNYRQNENIENRLDLMKASEDAWFKANDMVFASQNSAEQKVDKYKVSFIVLFFNIGLSLLIIFLIKRYVKDSLEYMVNYDSLTKAYNRRYFSDRIHNEIIRTERYGNKFSLIMLDIDFFKKVNDNYGHDVGDKLLREFSDLIRLCIRKTDLFARVGGEEFAIIVPETDLDGAVQLAEKIRKRIEKNLFVEGLEITASFGITQYISKDDMESVYKRADTALYKAKNNGRNRCETVMENVTEHTA